MFTPPFEVISPSTERSAFSSASIEVLLSDGTVPVVARILSVNFSGMKSTLQVV
jgi:hypothetical protein